MTCRYAVTFEFDTRPPITLRGTVEGWAASTCVARATRIAQKALKPVAWTSMVCCLLERLDAPQAADASDPHAASTGNPTTRVDTSSFSPAPKRRPPAGADTSPDPRDAAGGGAGEPIVVREDEDVHARPIGSDETGGQDLREVRDEVT